MVTTAKGASMQIAHVRKGGAAGLDDAPPAKLKKKVVAVRSSDSKETAARPLSTNSPLTKPLPFHALTPTPTPTPTSASTPPPPPPPMAAPTPPPTLSLAQPWGPRTSSSSPQQLKRPKNEPLPHDEQRVDDGEVSPDSEPAEGTEGDSTGAPLVPIAPATPGAPLPKDLIMAKHRAKPDAPKFLLMLYEILQNESDQVIRWTDDGLALQILDQSNVTEKVLPKYFNHTNFHSFQRQLNYFGFRKWTKSKTDICTFSHPYFRRNQPELMHLIKRKKATRRASAAEQAELLYPTEGYAAAASGASTNAAATGPPKKLLPLSPSGKRRLAHDPSKPGESRPHLESSKSASNGGSLPVLANSAHINSSAGQCSGSQSLLPSTAMLTNAISPASGGSKKKAKTSSSSKSSNPPELAPAGSAAASMLGDATMIANMGNFPKGALPNLDIVRNRLIYRQPPPGGAPSPLPGFPNGFQMTQSMNQPNSSSGADSAPQGATTPTSTTNHGQSSESNSMFTNSFSDPVDILLRIKKSRAMSQDNTLVQSPQQRTHGQVEGFASLQNFLLSQSMYTNRLESQLKLAVDENEALRHLVDAKQREVEALLNERKLIQNENSVLTEDKNKLFEINRDLLSKLFPQ